MRGYAAKGPAAGLAAIVLAGSLSGFAAHGGALGRGAQAPRTAKAAPRPKLVVMIVVDQMRSDYVDRFRSQWSGGLKRLLDEGVWFHEAAYPYAATETCVGHSTISTGAFPSTHGMIANA